MIHLDTSFLVRALIARTPEDARLRGWLGSGEALRLSAICWAEFACGPLDDGVLARAALLFSAPLPFHGEDAALAAKLFNQAGRRRGTLVDCMVAAAAIRAGATLATSNPQDFRRLEPLGLQVATA